MSKYPMNKRVFVDRTPARDFYIMHTTSCWYVEAFEVGTLNHDTKTIGGFPTLKSALRAIETWKGWL